MFSIKWQIWSAEKLFNSLPEIINKVEKNIDKIHNDYKEHIKYTIENLNKKFPTVQQIWEYSPLPDLLTLGNALFDIGIIEEKEGNLNEALLDFQLANELFRARGASIPRPNKMMREVMERAIYAIIKEDTGLRTQLRDGELELADVLITLKENLKISWGSYPRQFSLKINELVLTEVESILKELENDINSLSRFVRINYLAVRSLDIPKRMDMIIERWENLASNLAPSTWVEGDQTMERPKRLSSLLPTNEWKNISDTVANADVVGMKNILILNEEKLRKNLCLRLADTMDFIVPLTKLMERGVVNPEFLKAREKIIFYQDPQSLEMFKNINYRLHNTHFVAKEWYAYALSQFGKKGEIFEIIEQLKSVVSSEYFRIQWSWPALWNLACARARLQHKKEALDTLIPILGMDSHPTEAFEMCLRWALEENNWEVLRVLLPKAPFYEARLLAALLDFRSHEEEKDWEIFTIHFRIINHIISDLDYNFPDPLEEMNPTHLDELTRTFIEKSLLEAGIEWFEQRLFDDRESKSFKNWECAAILYERKGDHEKAWQSYNKLWWITYNNKKISNEKKRKKMEQTLIWAIRNKYKEAARGILRNSCRGIEMTIQEVDAWERKLTSSVQEVNKSEEPEIKRAGAKLIDDVQKEEEKKIVIDKPDKMSVEDAEVVIQKYAKAFSVISHINELANMADIAYELLKAVEIKHPHVTKELIFPLIKTIQLAETFSKGVEMERAEDLAKEMNEQLDIICSNRSSYPVEVHWLREACERVIQRQIAWVKLAPDLTITPPSDLRVVIGRPKPNSILNTRIPIRIANKTEEPAVNIECTFSSISDQIKFPEPKISITQISQGATTILECPADVLPGVPEYVDLYIQLIYKIGNIQGKPVKVSCKIAVREITDIPAELRYTTETPIGPDRPDLFHGRDREIEDLAKSFTGGKLRILYFVTGIRSVGKSSLVENLAARCPDNILAIDFTNIEKLLDNSEMTSAEFVYNLIRIAIRDIKEKPLFKDLNIKIPVQQDFNSFNPAWIIFEDWLIYLLRETHKDAVLLCFDEVQKIVKKIANPNDKMDPGFLTFLREKIQTNSNILAICTGSEPYELMKSYLRDDHLWRHVTTYNISFVSRDAMEKIATVPVMNDGVYWLPEAIDKLWVMTEGHPAATQLIAKHVMKLLNNELRRIVTPEDVNRAAEYNLNDEILALWWNEKWNLLGETHNQIAQIILMNQKGFRQGIPMKLLFDKCTKAGMKNIGRFLDEMKALDVLSYIKDGEDVWYNIRSGFLERYLKEVKFKPKDVEEENRKISQHSDRPLGLFIDVENIKRNLLKKLREMTEEAQAKFGKRLNGEAFAEMLFKHARTFGDPKARWAVADWDQAIFSGDQKAFRQIGIMTDICGQEKKDASDHVLKEHIHRVLREQKDISVYVLGTGDGDFVETVRTLQDEGKDVIVWFVHGSRCHAYVGELMQGAFNIQIEWIEDIIFS